MSVFNTKKIIFWGINLLVAVSLLFLIGYVVLQRLDSYTLHGQYISVPDLRGLTPSEAAPFLSRKKFIRRRYRLYLRRSRESGNCRRAISVSRIKGKKQPDHSTHHQCQRSGKVDFPESKKHGIQTDHSKVKKYRF